MLECYAIMLQATAPTRSITTSLSTTEQLEPLVRGRARPPTLTTAKLHQTPTTCTSTGATGRPTTTTTTTRETGAKLASEIERSKLAVSTSSISRASRAGIAVSNGAGTAVLRKSCCRANGAATDSSSVNLAGGFTSADGRTQQDTGLGRRPLMATRSRPVLSVTAAGLLCSSVTVLLYANSLGCGLCFDDETAIMKNADLRPSAPWSDLLRNDFWGNPMAHPDSHKSYRPLTVATFRLNYLLHGLEPTGYHLANVLLHGAVCFLYVQLCALVFGREAVWPSLMAGLLFAVHPIHTEAVTGVVGRADVICGLLFLISFISYQKFVAVSPTNKGSGLKWVFVFLVSWISSILSKETGITSVAVCLCWDWFVNHEMNLGSTLNLLLQYVQQGRLKSSSSSHLSSPKSSKKIMSSRSRSCTLASNSSNLNYSCRLFLLTRESFGLRAFGLSTLLLAVLYARWKIMVSPPKYSVLNNPAVVLDYPYKQLHWSYIASYNCWLLLNPSSLCIEYAMQTIPFVTSLLDPRNLVTVATLLSLGGLSLYGTCGKGRGRDRKVAFVGMCLLVVPFLPASNLFFPVGFVVAERVLYIPSMGFSMLVGHGAWKIWNAIDDMHHRNRNRNDRVVFANVEQKFEKVERRRVGKLLIEKLIAVIPTRALVSVLLLLGGTVLVSHSAKTVLRNGDWESELALYSSAVRVTPNNAKMWHNLGSKYAVSGDHAQAEALYRRAVEEDPLYVSPLSDLGHVLMRQQKLGEAEEMFRKAIFLIKQGLSGKDPLIAVSLQNLDAFTRLAKLLKTMHKNTSADAHLKEAAELYEFVRQYRSTDVKTLLALGDLYTTANRTKEAIDTLQQAVQIAPGDPNAVALLGYALMEAGDKREAEVCFRRSLGLIESWKGGGGGGRGKGGETWKYVTYHLVDLLLSREMDVVESKGKEGKEEEEEEEGEEERSSDDKGRLREAERLLMGMVSSDPTDVSVAFKLGLVYLDLGDHSRAEEVFLRVVAIEPSHIGALHNLGLLHFKAERFSSALPYLRDLVRHHPSHTQGLTQLASCLSRLGAETEVESGAKELSSEAMEVLLRLHKLDPQNTNTLYQLGMVSKRLHRWSETERYLKEFVQLSPIDSPSSMKARKEIKALKRGLLQKTQSDS